MIEGKLMQHERQGFTFRQGPPLVPDRYFEDILFIWDTFRSFAGIVKDILSNHEDPEMRSIGVNVGSVTHLKHFFREYFLQLSLNDFYECFKQIESNQFYVDILLFLSSFYMKQIIEDVEQENSNLRFYNKGSLWQLFNFLYMRDQSAYFEVITERAYELPIDIQNYGILLIEDETVDGESFSVRLQLVKDLCEGLMDLKKTATILQFRTESILYANRMRVTYSKDFKETRAQVVALSNEITAKEQQAQALRTQAENSELPRQEQTKLIRQADSINKEINKLKAQQLKEKKNLEEIQANYDSLAEANKLTGIQQLYHNPSIFLGSDCHQQSYYFFLHDPCRIYYLKQNENKQWGYINKIEHVDKNLKGDKTAMLSENLALLIKSQLFVTEQGPPKQTHFIEYNQQPSWSRVVNSLLSAELMLSNYLASHQGRWVGPEERKQFRSALQAIINVENKKELMAKLEFFLEKTIMQERLEIRQDENDDMMEIEQPEPQQVSHKRRVVEDESDSLTAEGSQLNVLEHMDPAKIKVKKLPLKLFGNIQDNIRSCCQDLIRSEDASISDVMLVIFIMERVITDYVNRKLEKEKEQIKQMVEEVTKFEPPHQIEKHLRTRTQQKPQYVESDVHNWEDCCKMCGLTGKVICCDTCPSVFHAKCLGLKQIPQGKWSCVSCLSKMEAQIKTRATLKKFQA